MIQRVGVEFQPGDTASEGTLDGPVEQPGTDAPADIGQRQTEEGLLPGLNFVHFSNSPIHK